MGEDQQNIESARAAVRRRAVDAATAGRDSNPLTAPRYGERMAAAVSGAITGIAIVALLAVAASMPWAVGVLVFQGPVGWQSSLARWALLLA
jgi:hypothetical protein